MTGLELTRAGLLERLADLIDSIERPHPIRVAIDGPDAAGKTRLADELADFLRARGREVVRASLDGFHRPRAERYRRGELSPQGYYEDAFDLGALRRVLLDPLGPGGDRVYRGAVFDLRADAPLSDGPTLASVNAVLLLDGIFLLRPELTGSWDFRIYVRAEFHETLTRALDRDRELFGSREEVQRRYERRYIPAHERYIDTVRTAATADIVIDNDDPARPVLRENRGLSWRNR